MGGALGEGGAMERGWGPVALGVCTWVCVCVVRTCVNEARAFLGGLRHAFPCIHPALPRIAAVHPLLLPCTCRLARIVNCSDCNICIGAVSTLLRIQRCERLQLTAAAGQVVVLSCHSCCLHLGTHRQPAILGDCRWESAAQGCRGGGSCSLSFCLAGLGEGRGVLYPIH